MDHALHFVFPAPVLRFADAFRYHYVPLPDDVADALRLGGITRIVVTVNGCVARRAVQRRADGTVFVVFGRSLLREAALREGDTALVELVPDPDPGHIDIPPEFEAALAEDAEAAARFASFSAGRQRSLAYYVASAKRPETRRRRADELAYKLRSYALYGDILERRAAASGGSAGHEEP